MAYTLDPAKMRKGNTATVKFCPGCKEHKSRATDFYRNGARGDGLKGYCKVCNKKQEQAKSQSARHRGRRYGLTRSEIEAMLEGQERKCASCRDDLQPGRMTHVDHCHATGHVRGILCLPCNLALGYLKDCTDRIEALAAYLSRTAS